jgi:hypothetical protein
LVVKKRALSNNFGAVLVVVGVLVSMFTSWTVAGVGVGNHRLRRHDARRRRSDAFPQPAGLARKESADNKASYAFGGVTNTASQGYPVPLLYGKRRIGGAIISAGIYVEDQQ